MAQSAAFDKSSVNYRSKSAATEKLEEEVNVHEDCNADVKRKQVPSYDNLLGALSLIIWSVTLMVTVKYVTIVLRADDEGEGGTFAVYSLLSRYANIVRRDPREEVGIKMERVETSNLPTASKATRTFLEQSSPLKAFLKVVGVFGVSLVMSGEPAGV
ncbi:MAG: hypothetical protein Q9190_002413 [Brigantiaea leucoxantha]